jgi:hypothetical protein
MKSRSDLRHRLRDDVLAEGSVFFHRFSTECLKFLVGMTTLGSKEGSVIVPKAAANAEPQMHIKKWMLSSARHPFLETPVEKCHPNAFAGMYTFWCSDPT